MFVVERMDAFVDRFVVFERVLDHVFVQLEVRHAGTEFAQVTDHDVFRHARQFVDVLFARTVLKDLEDSFEGRSSENGRVVCLVACVVDGSERSGSGHHVGQ